MGGKNGHGPQTRHDTKLAGNGLRVIGFVS